MARVLIAGCGYVGTELGLRLAADGHEVFGLRREPGRLPAGIRPVAADLTDATTLQALPAGCTAVVYTAAAAGFDDDAYRAAYVDGLRNLLDALAARGERVGRVLFTSSTGVYGQNAGEWVDEESATEPEHFSGRRLVEAEQLLFAGPFPGVALRLGGIYGPGRTRLVENVRRGSAVCHEDRRVFTNRIHRDDAAGALRHLLALPRPERLYNGVDDEPVEQVVLLHWLAKRLGAPAPIPSATADPASVRQPRTNKRVRNARLVASGFAFRYPSFREGYEALIGR